MIVRKDMKRNVCIFTNMLKFRYTSRNNTPSNFVLLHSSFDYVHLILNPHYISNEGVI
jgi:hypothetical protein